MAADDMAADRLYGLVFNRKWDAATKLLQEASPEQVSYAVPHGWTVLHQAVNRGAPAELVQMLIGKGANVNAESITGKNALYLAAEEGFAEIARVLIKDGGARVQDKSFTPPGDYRDILQHNDDFCMTEQTLMSAMNAPRVTGSTPLHVAAEKGHLVVVQVLIKEASADPNIQTHSGFTPLYSAVIGNHPEVARWLIKDGGANVNAASNIGSTALSVAAELGQLPCVEVLIEEGADVEISNSKGETPLYFAADLGRLDLVQVLLQAGAKANGDRFKGRASPLFMASAHGHTDIVRALLRAHGEAADVSTPGYMGYTPLYVAALENRLETMEVLIKEGKANVNAKDRDGRTALHRAVAENHVEAVKYLVTQDAADVNAQSNGETPLHYAAERGHLDVARFLVEEGGADPSLMTRVGFVVAV